MWITSMGNHGAGGGGGGGGGISEQAGILVVLVDFWSHSAKFPPYPGLLLVEQFPCIYRQAADWVELRFDEQTH